MSSDESGAEENADWATDALFGGRGRQGGRSKDDAIYGVFMEEEERGTAGLGAGRRKRGRGKGDESGGAARLLQPVQFVSAGRLEQPSKKKAQPMPSEALRREQEERDTARMRSYMPGMEDDVPAHAGLGFSAASVEAPAQSGLGIGFAAASSRPAGKRSENAAPTFARAGLGFSRPAGTEAPAEGGDGAGNDDFRRKMSERERAAREEEDKMESARRRMMEAAAAPVRVSRDFGHFEKSTKGVGLKILQKFGFKGRLGKHGQGIAEPIAAKPRPNRVGLGAVKEATSLRQNREVERHLYGRGGEEEEEEGGDGERGAPRRGQSRRRGAGAGVQTVALEEVLAARGSAEGAGPGGDEDEDAYLARVAREATWARRGPAKPEKSMQDVVREATAGGGGGGGGAPAAGAVRIVDMRGPEVRIAASFADVDLSGGPGRHGGEEGEEEEEVVEIGDVVPSVRGRRGRGEEEGEEEGEGDEEGEGEGAVAGRRARALGRELLYNLRVLVDGAEADLHAAARRQREAEVEAEAAEAEATARRAALAAAERRARRQAELRDMVAGCRDLLRAAGAEAGEAVEGAVVASERCAATVRRIARAYGAELLRAGPSRVLPALAGDALATVARRWTLEGGPAPLASALRTWRGLLVEEGLAPAPAPAGGGGGGAREEAWAGVGEAAAEAYAAAVDAAVVPALQRAALRGWVVRAPAPLVGAWEALRGLVPAARLESLLEQCVLPRLRREAEAWDPRADAAGAHAWVLPWRPLLGARLRSVYAPLRQRLSAALAAWTPEDASALAVLRPWHGVWEEAAWAHLVLRRVAPRLAEALRGLEIDPRGQRLDAWRRVRAWLPLLPPGHAAALVCGELLPRWLRVLHAWLRQGGDAREAARWYVGWRRELPATVVAAPRAQQFLRAALDLLNAAAAGALAGADGAGDEGAAAEAEALLAAPCSYHGELDRARRREEEEAAVARRREEEAARGEAAARVRREAAERARREAARQTRPTFREAVQAEAEANGLVFAPNPRRGRAPDGQPLYSFGAETVYLHDHVIFAERDEGGGRRAWEPMALSDLVAAALRARR